MPSNKRRRATEGAMVFPVAMFVIGVMIVFSEEPITMERSIQEAQKQVLVQQTTVQAQGPIDPVDCEAITPREPVNISNMQSYKEIPYQVSFSWWDRRLKHPQFGTAEMEYNDSVQTVQRLLRDTEGAFIDVGANAGFMTQYGLALKRPTYAIEPISYNVAKLCEGYRANVAKKYALAATPFFLYHAAAGSEYVPEIAITRPADEVGYFDQSSLSRAAVLQQKVTEERIPLITIDSIIPLSLPVAVLKIDVQGYEYAVLQGAKQLLQREERYPEYVFFEESPTHIQKAGFRVGASQEFLEEMGYNCMKDGGDILCQKL
ncbi:hypothetical protein FisN_4Hu351 [Fistulifera solaris]|uniref:Methyltransferase FkbM domain-containing protein n=1 Tax=Fistulifera solaris TaxID=1519565 RepID=A0A1Z5KRB8_FISSO|nr:hypothetical protein FisN_4Hu351 [Fistulifera solaris]|eukprot:GAX28458.1 hypothetical protein FisN_4Hu351 [Fistulifera solaris]